MAKPEVPQYNATFPSLLTTLFVGLKLTHYISWSWWWVLAPLWGPVAFILVVAAAVGLGALLLGS